MEQKTSPNFEFKTAPPAYDQHMNYPQQFQSPPNYIPNTSQHPQVVTVIHATHFGPNSTVVSCPSCQKIVNTRVDFEPSTRTHLMAGIICLIFWPLFCLPYMVNGCKNGNHYCSNCGAYLGSYRG